MSWDQSSRGHAVSLGVFKQTFGEGWQWSVSNARGATTGTASSEAEAWRKARAVAAIPTVGDLRRRIIP